MAVEPREPAAPGLPSEIVAPDVPALRTANDSDMRGPPGDSPFVRQRLARGFRMRNRVLGQFFYEGKPGVREQYACYFLAARYRMTRTFSSVIRPPSTMASRRGKICSMRSVGSTISTMIGKSCDSRRILSV